MKKWHWLILALLTIASIIAGLLMHHEPPHNHLWDTFPVFWVLFGFIGCAALIVFAKKILAPIIYKKEDYYND
ncbi:MAG: hypothetical protein KAW12_25305 [Candidatus Aminicenantes bacterium]|nr:hypothetical protein [Candidatus Aminicenantes bacterium]